MEFLRKHMLDVGCFYKLLESRNGCESELFNELISTFNVTADFAKVDTLEKYITFRDELANKFVEQLSKQDLLKLFKTTITSGPAPEAIAIKAPSKGLSKTQRRNRSRRKTHRPTKAVVPPPVSAPAVDDPPFEKRRRLQEGLVVDWNDDPFYMTKRHVKYMPIIEDLKMTKFQLRMVRCVTDSFIQEEPVVHRSMLPNQYRSSVGLHMTEEQCHLCDELSTRNYLDDDVAKGSRRSAVVALHFWIMYGGSWVDFNAWHLPWYKDLLPDGDHFPAYDRFDGYFSDYLANNKYAFDGSQDQHRPYTAKELLETDDPAGDLLVKLRGMPPHVQTLWCRSSSLKRK
jgi:hypothetical protein